MNTENGIGLSSFSGTIQYLYNIKEEGNTYSVI